MALGQFAAWAYSVSPRLTTAKEKLQERVAKLSGGVALIRTLKGLKDLEGANEDQTVGIRLLARALEEPLRQIVENAGEDAAVVLNAVKAGKGAYGYNAATGENGDMLEAKHSGSDQGHAACAAERRFGGGFAAHDGSDDCRCAEG